ncbi:DUF3397 domain-containing protein [Paenibacillus endoradicis]|uniref:DUF3397 domain-containing protein n=1 Tax=Paenibacillus endoradicis TaxID=2972487 RepID=UPI0021594C42|nr:DUF3397 domain-containing protein [Paenibacillus endoradicis]MCR8655990.1 DUF3397 domain-containing protein [Paenibacillus endoradicis]MCR8658316.1 DUF3397 domain-containing protein [Paenibacillus endoradicis]
MWDFIRNIFSGIAIIPIFPFIIVFLGYGAFVKDRKKAIRVAMDVSTIFFIPCVAALFNELFNSEFGIYGILLVMIIGGGLLGNMHYRKDGIIPWKKILRVVWRITFFATAFLYIIFIIVMLLQLAFTVS